MLNVTYSYLSQGRNQQQMMELDLILAGPDGVDEDELAKRNAEAMRQLGAMAPGALVAKPTGKPRKKRTVDGDA